MRVNSRKFLSIALLLMVSALALYGASSTNIAAVNGISFKTADNSVEATITAAENAKFTYFELRNPHRLVVDFHGVQNEIGFKEKRIGSGGVNRVRTSYFTDDKRKATRVVFDLTDSAKYRVLEDGDGLEHPPRGEDLRHTQFLADQS